MLHYDDLPKKVREFLANAKMNYAAVTVWDMVKEEGEYLTLCQLRMNEKLYR
jgi:hypothetical protein